MEIECPACGKTLIVPHPNPVGLNKNAPEKSRQVAQHFDDRLKNQQKAVELKKRNSVSIPKTNTPPPKTQHRNGKSVFSGVEIVAFVMLGLLNMGLLCVGAYVWWSHLNEQKAARAAQVAADMRRAEENLRLEEQRKVEMAARFLTQVIGAGLENARENALQQQRAEEEKRRNSLGYRYLEEQKRQSQIYWDEKIREKARRGEEPDTWW